MILIDIEHIQDKAYKRLLQNQYKAIKKDKLKIVEIATALRTLLGTDGELLPAYDQRVKQRCCDFLALEEGCRKFRMSDL